MRYVLLAFCGLLAAAGGQELLRNPGFEDSLAYWEVEQTNYTGSWTIVAGPGYDPDPDLEACVHKYNRYCGRLRQTVRIPFTELEFSCSARLSAELLSGTGYHAHAAVVVEYQNCCGMVLGRTMIVRRTPGSGLYSSATQHLIEVASDDWEDYEFVIADELAGLSGVDPDDVDRVSVYLESFSTGRTG